MAYNIPIPPIPISPCPSPIPFPCLRFHSHSDDKCSKYKYSTVLASLSQLASRDLTFFVFSTRPGTCLANEYDLVAHGWHQTGHIMHPSSPVWVDRWEFWYTWKSSHCRCHVHFSGSHFWHICVPIRDGIAWESYSHAHLYLLQIRSIGLFFT